MVTETKKRYQTATTFLYEFAGLSTDTKPTKGVANGSMFREVDTGFKSYYDEENKVWSSQGEENGEEEGN